MLRNASRVSLLLGVLLGVLFAAVSPVSSAFAGDTGSGLFVTFAARACPTYTDITANRARNDIQESLRDLGADTPYRPGEAMNPTIEQAHQPACHPLPNWTFTLGTNYRSRAVSGPWGSLSIVTGPFAAPSIVTAPSTPLLDDLGHPTGESLAGATTIELTPAQAAIATRPNSLWTQGGTTDDPILNRQFPGEYGFGALRCAIDDLNGDNVEWIGFPTGVRHVFCFAYYVQPPPTSGTIVIRKEIRGPAGSSETFPFQGNLSFNQRGLFSLSVKNGQVAQQTFIRAETRPGDAPWTATELVPPNWKLDALSCTSQSGHSQAGTDLATATASIALAASDTVTCTYADELIPPNGGLLVRKLTLGGAGRFSFAVQPAAGGTSTSLTAETLQPELAVDATPGPLTLPPGGYHLTEEPPTSPDGRWSLTGVECDGHPTAVTQPIAVPIASGVGSVCTLTNTFTPSGSIVLEKINLGDTATTGFVITPLTGTPTELHQSVTTTQPGVAATAAGDPTHDLPLGRYLVQETTEPTAEGNWELTAVQCDGQDQPFADGQATLTLSTTTPHQTCTFTNTLQKKEIPVPPKPPQPTPDPESHLTVTKQAERSTVGVGEPSPYVLTVTNHGPDAAEDVVIDDQPSGPARFQSAEPGQGSCTHAVPTTCQLGMVPAGRTVKISITVIPTEPGMFPNRAVLGSATLDPLYTNAAAVADVRSEGARRPPAPSREPAPHFTG